ncbi:MAG: thioether cross-link-forming SCIFF peptide maturase [Oscillospiraceae bacterium]|nr:thioether cross-link-forming SCIFF peptide maturase [Oscillospiraceae bacterium]
MIHKYCLNGFYILLDTNSGAVHLVDEMIFDILDLISLPMSENIPEEILNNQDLKKYNKQDVIEGYSEIFYLYKNGQLFSEDSYKNFVSDQFKMPLKAMCLHIAHDCNLRCKYCFASTGDFGTSRSLMSLEVGKKAIDFLIKNSEARKNLEIDFFGGEPLMNFDVVKEIVKYAREQEKIYDKNFRFTITTNGVLLDDNKIDFINKEMSNVVLSLDGRKEINDKMRKTCNGAGSYDIIVDKFKNLAKKRNYENYYIRGTFTKNNLDFLEDIVHFSDLGFDQISIEPVVTDSSKDYAITESDLSRIFDEYENLANEMIRRYKNKKQVLSEGKDVNKIKNKDRPFNFFHFMIDLDQGPCVLKRLRGCGSGNEYIAVTPEGDIYPCHQFVGKQEWKMGSVIDSSFNTEIKKTFADTNIYTKPDCQDCWAKFYCSGGCSANNLFYAGSLKKPYKISCEMMKKRLECAIMIRIVEKQII